MSEFSIFYWEKRLHACMHLARLSARLTRDVNRYHISPSETVAAPISLKAGAIFSNDS